MTKKQRVALWRRMSQCFDRHEREMIKIAKRERRVGPCQAHAYEEEDEKRMDVIGQNGNTGEHYFCADKGNRGNWWGLADDWDESDEIEASKNDNKKKDSYKGANYSGRNPEPDATGAEEDLPSAAEDNAKVRGNYEI